MKSLQMTQMNTTDYNNEKIITHITESIHSLFSFFKENKPALHTLWFRDTLELFSNIYHTVTKTAFNMIHWSHCVHWYEISTPFTKKWTIKNVPN